MRRLVATLMLAAALAAAAGTAVRANDLPSCGDVIHAIVQWKYVLYVLTEQQGMSYDEAWGIVGGPIELLEATSRLGYDSGGTLGCAFLIQQ